VGLEEIVLGRKKTKPCSQMFIDQASSVSIFLGRMVPCNTLGEHVEQCCTINSGI